MTTAAPAKRLNDMILAHLDGRPMSKLVERSGIQKDRFRRIVAGELRMYADEAVWLADELGVGVPDIVAAIPSNE